MGAEVPLTPAGASASSAERGDLGAAAAIGHDGGTRWRSAISRVRIDWENAHASEYLLQVSDDGSAWTTIRQVTNSRGGTEDLTGLDGRGRYLRVHGVRRAGQYGYSIFEIQAHSGSPAAPGQSADPGQPLPDLSRPGVVVKPVEASSSVVENPGLAAAQALDGNPATRWASRFEDGAWIQFDFGARTQVGYMKLQWERRCQRQLLMSLIAMRSNCSTEVTRPPSSAQCQPR